MVPAWKANGLQILHDGRCRWQQHAVGDDPQSICSWGRAWQCHQPAHLSGDRCRGDKGVILGEGQLRHEWCCCPCTNSAMKQDGHSAMHQTLSLRLPKAGAGHSIWDLLQQGAGCGRNLGGVLGLLTVGSGTRRAGRSRPVDHTLVVSSTRSIGGEG